MEKGWMPEVIVTFCVSFFLREFAPVVKVFFWFIDVRDPQIVEITWSERNLIMWLSVKGVRSSYSDVIFKPLVISDAWYSRLWNAMRSSLHAIFLWYKYSLPAYETKICRHFQVEWFITELAVMRICSLSCCVLSQFALKISQDGSVDDYLIGRSETVIVLNTLTRRGQVFGWNKDKADRLWW